MSEETDFEELYDQADARIGYLLGEMRMIRALANACGQVLIGKLADDALVAIEGRDTQPHTYIRQPEDETDDSLLAK